MSLEYETLKELKEINEKLDVFLEILMQEEDIEEEQAELTDKGQQEIEIN